MKFTSAFVATVMALPLLASAAPRSSSRLMKRQNANQRGGNNNNNNNNNNNGNNGNNGGNNNGGNNGGAGGDPQTSLTLDPAVIAPGFAQNGQQVPVDGQVASLTSTNNFINFCVGQTITDGKQVTQGSCNPAPIGVIPSVDRMPSSKFSFPANGATIQADQQFEIKMNVINLITGNFVNAQTNYFAAPQQLQGGQIVGHTHVVIQALQALDQTNALDPKVFTFFKGVNGAAQNGEVTADVTAGVPAGAYRLCSINTAANHQPAIVPVAQHGSLDDCIYFTATANGQAAGGAAAGNNAGNGAAAGNNNNNGQNNNNAGNNNNAQNNNNNAGNNNNNAGNNNAGNGAAAGAGAAAGNGAAAGGAAGGAAAGGAAAGGAAAGGAAAGGAAAGGAAAGGAAAGGAAAGGAAAGGAAAGGAAAGNNNQQGGGRRGGGRFGGRGGRNQRRRF